MKSIQNQKFQVLIHHLGITACLAKAILIKHAWDEIDAINNYLGDKDYLMK